MNKIPVIAKTGRFLLRYPPLKVIVIVLLTVFAGTMNFFGFYYMQIYMKHSALKTDIDNIKKKIAEINRDILLTESFLDAEKEVQHIMNRLKYNKGTTGILRDINNLDEAKRLKLSIENTENRQEQIEGYRISHQEIIAEGSYSDMREFIYGLEKMPGMVAFTRVKIEKDGSKPGQIKSALRIALYGKEGGRNE